MMDWNRVRTGTWVGIRWHLYLPEYYTKVTHWHESRLRHMRCGDAPVSVGNRVSASALSPKLESQSLKTLGQCTSMLRYCDHPNPELKYDSKSSNIIGCDYAQAIYLRSIWVRIRNSVPKQADSCKPFYIGT